MKRKGQAEVMDGLILMLIAATCSVVLLSIASNYGHLPVEIYENSYSQKLAQNTLLSLYHITYLGDESAPSYKKSIMVAVSRELSNRNLNIRDSTDPATDYLEDILKGFHDEIGWHFMFALLSEDLEIVDGSLMSSDTRVLTGGDFKRYAGNPTCASAALTYPYVDGCVIGGEAGNMCYAIFQVCAWLE